MKTVVIYHSADFDGLFCREIAKKFLGTENVTYIGWDYGEPTPGKEIIDGTERLFIMDLSVPDLMDHPKLIWIDHHKSAIEKYPETIPGYRIDGVAACRLAWQWFVTNQEFALGASHVPFPHINDYRHRIVTEPLSVRLAGEFDVWDKRDPNAELFQFGLKGVELTEALWAKLLQTVPAGMSPLGRDLINSAVDDLLQIGRNIQFYQNQQDAQAIQRCGYTVVWQGLTFLVCNWGARHFNSISFEAGIKPEHDALLGYRFDGEKFQVSLYHAPDKEQHDLSEIAKKYRGGGHKGACGFTCQFLPDGICPDVIVRKP